jgi:hypothetical protein
MDDPILSMTLSCNSGSSSSDAAEQDSPQESEEMAAVEEEPSEVEASSLVLDVLGVPTVIKHYPVPATKKSPYWRFYRVLKVPLTHHGKNRNKDQSFNFQSQKKLHHALHESTQRFYLLQQGRHITVQHYLEQFQNAVDVLEHSEGPPGWIHDWNRICTCRKEKHRYRRIVQRGKT